MEQQHEGEEEEGEEEEDKDNEVEEDEEKIHLVDREAVRRVCPCNTRFHV